jgi:hypothetical protein
MAAKTTNVDLKGDRVQARSLAEAHVPRLMFDFRRNQSFQDLAIYSETKKFFDSSGQYVGTVYMQSVNGAENIVVSCDAGKPPVEEKKFEEPVVPTPLAQFVPCIRSTDNQYWVACMSGTFEGPYRVFRNTLGVTAEQMSDTNEAALNRKFLSTDGELQLYFIAQTGTRDTGTLDMYNVAGGLLYDHNFSYIEDPRTTIYGYDALWTAYRLSNPSRCVECLACHDAYPAPCVGPEPVYIPTYDIDFSYDDTFYHYYKYKGDKLNIDEYEEHLAKSKIGISGTYHLGSCVNVPNPLITYEYSYFNGEALLNYNFSSVVVKGMNLEDIENFACFYVDIVDSCTDTKSNTMSDCEAHHASQQGPEMLPNVTSRAYHFQVNEDTFPFYSPPDFTETRANYIDAFQGDIHRTDQSGLIEVGMVQYECYSDRNMLKYYGEESLASTAGIMCGRVNTWQYDEDGFYLEEKCAAFHYNYIGPNNVTDNGRDITTTTFVPEGADIQSYVHTIPNIQANGEDIKFKGEVFMGMIL